MEFEDRDVALEKYRKELGDDAGILDDYNSSNNPLRNSYILTPEKLRSAKKDLCILHPLPRVNEISVAVDDDPRACYFKQVRNGRFIRMALILKLLGIE